MGGGNRICLSNPEFDELNRIADSTVDTAARQEAINAEAMWLVDYRGHVPLLAPISTSGYRTEVQGLQWSVSGGAFYFNTSVGN